MPVQNQFWALQLYLDRVKRIWFLSPMRAAKVQASLRMRAVSPEPPLLAHTSSESRGTFRQKARSLAPLKGWACAVKICHNGMLEDTNSLDGAPLLTDFQFVFAAQITSLVPNIVEKIVLSSKESLNNLPGNIFSGAKIYTLEIKITIKKLSCQCSATIIDQSLPKVSRLVMVNHILYV